MEPRESGPQYVLNDPGVMPVVDAYELQGPVPVQDAEREVAEPLIRGHLARRSEQVGGDHAWLHHRESKGKIPGPGGGSRPSAANHRAAK